MIIHEPSNSLLLRSRNPEQILETLPKSRAIDYQGHNVAVRFGLDEAIVLRNMGLKKIPSPIRYGYHWPGVYNPFAHQVDTAEFLTLHRRAFILSDPGTSKTAAAIWAADYLIDKGKIKKVLIIAPLSCINTVWKHDIFSVAMHRSCTVIHGPKEKRLDAMKEHDVDFYIINHDGVALHLKELEQLKPDLVIVDEGSFFRNHDTRKWKFMNSAIKPSYRVWWITGTPCPNAPTDAWAQAKIMGVPNVPKFFGQFKRQVMVQVSQFKWVPAVGGYEAAYNLLQPAIRFRKTDCLDLPPVLFEDREVEMTADQRRHASSMTKEMSMELKDKNKVITAVHAADKINKLRQIFCGSIKLSDTEEYIDIDYSSRYKVLKECIEGAAAKVIVICPYKGALRRLEADLEKDYTVGVLNGDVSPRRRDHIIDQFRTSPDPHILLCHPKVMAHGLNLTKADVLVFFAPITSTDETIQAMERFNRPGQTRKMTIYRLFCCSLEKEIYKLVEERRLGQDTMLKLFEKAAKGV